jgi:hypothetical protein
MKIAVFFTLLVTSFYVSCSKSNRQDVNDSQSPPQLGNTSLLVSSGKTFFVISSQVVSTGGNSITAKGYCWSKFSNPTLANNYLVSTSTSATFTDTIKGLTYNTTYYIRPYATNNLGTSYGAELQLRTENTSFTIGQAFEGGNIFYIDSTGEHGLVCAPISTIRDLKWAQPPQDQILVGNTSLDIGFGFSNTNTIISAGINTSNVAAGYCSGLSVNGYSDWFLPSYRELVFLRTTPINIPLGNIYLSSSESGPAGIYALAWGGSVAGPVSKSDFHTVIPIRKF